MWRLEQKIPAISERVYMVESDFQRQKKKGHFGKKEDRGVQRGK